MMRTLLLITAITLTTSAAIKAENGSKWRLVAPESTSGDATLKDLILIDSQDSRRDQLDAKAKTESADPRTSRNRASVQSPPVNSISLDISPSAGRLPEDVAEPAFAEKGSVEHHGGIFRDDTQFATTQTHYRWVAPWIAYNPLYFDDPRLERDGFHFGYFEPVVSAAKFYGRIPLWPYMAGATHPHECVYSLGQGRPGDCRPYHGMSPKKSVRGAAYQAAAITGGVLLLP